MYAAHLANALRPKSRFAGVVCTYSCGGRAVDQSKGMLTNLKAEFLETVAAKGCPRPADFQSLDRLADAVAARHREQGLA